MQSLAGKTAIITGAAAPRGIGRAAAVSLARAGSAVVITDRAGPLDLEDGTRERMELLAESVEAIRAAGGQAAALELDVTDPRQIAEVVAESQEAFGGLDILVNNAGTTIGSGPFLAATSDEWEVSFQVNLLGVMRMCQAVIPGLQARGGGSIVNVGSTGSLGAEAGFGAYTAMKHGLIGLTKTLAAEFGRDGIRCNAVCPGYVATDMHEGVNKRLATARGLSVEAIREERYAAVALGRAATPEEVGEAILYLAGPASAYTTGVALPVAGGVPFGI